MRYTTLAWRSSRVCRSSLSAESQACATATDELMITKLFYSLMLDPDQDLRSGETVKKAGQSAVVIDARALYDATKRDTIKNAVDKRAAVEILYIKEALEFTGSEIRWVSSERQLADGLTLADALGGGYIQLVFDETFTAAKKKTKESQRRTMMTSTGSSSTVASWWWL